MATNQPPRAPGHGKDKSVLHNVGGRRPAVLIGGGAAVLVAVYALYQRSNNANSGAATTAAAPASTYDSTLTDMENQFENQIEALQAQIAGLPTGGTTPATGSTPTPVINGGSPPVNVKAPPPSSTPFKPPAPKPAAQHTQAVVRVQKNNTLSGIAAKFGETWQQVWAYNLTPGVRSAADQATLRKRGANLIFPNEEIYIPSR